MTASTAARCRCRSSKSAAVSSRVEAERDEAAVDPVLVHGRRPRLTALSQRADDTEQAHESRLPDRVCRRPHRLGDDRAQGAENRVGGSGPRVWAAGRGAQDAREARVPGRTTSRPDGEGVCARDAGERLEVTLDPTLRGPEHVDGALHEAGRRAVDAEQGREAGIGQQRVRCHDDGVRLLCVEDAVAVRAAARHGRVDDGQVRREVPDHVDGDVRRFAAGHLGEDAQERVEAPGIRVDEARDRAPDDDARVRCRPRT